MAKRNVRIDEDAYTFEEWARLGIEQRNGLEFIHVEAHAVADNPIRRMCFHVVHAYFDIEEQENVGIASVLRQNWDAGGYCLKPEVVQRAETRSGTNKNDVGYDPLIGRLP